MLRRLPLLRMILFAACTLPGCATYSTDSAPKPLNVVLVMTDDQGYGDLGIHGNPLISTPHIDAMATRGVRFDSFYVNPVCAPTRAALMTGRYTQRTCAIDTYIGRAMLEPEETTVAEILEQAGWATGIFGKWHLGDCPPLRAMDQGFEEALVHRGGGIGQPSDPEGGERRYTDPVLFHNGEREETVGYCTDVYFSRAVAWMKRSKGNGRPFFAYIAPNAPHGPFHDVPKARYQALKTRDLSPSQFPDVGHPIGKNHNNDKLARIYAMIENIDDNMGFLFESLDAMDALDNTLVIFMVDNGPNTQRYVSGLRGMKSHVHEGGVRSPLVVHWPDRLKKRHVTGQIGAHIDMLPTILDACDVPSPSDLDGVSLLPLLEGKGAGNADRTIVVQSHRGDFPVRYHNAMIRRGKWKLVNPSGFREAKSITPRFQLYDLSDDPSESRDLAVQKPGIVGELRAAYDHWFDDVGGNNRENYAPPRIHVGSPSAPECVLTRQDWRRTSKDGGWSRTSLGHWEVEVVRPGDYSARITFLKGTKPRRFSFRAAGRTVDIQLPKGSTEHTFNVRLPAGPAQVEVEAQDAEGRIYGAYQVHIRLIAGT